MNTITITIVASDGYEMTRTIEATEEEQDHFVENTWLLADEIQGRYRE